MRIRAQPLLLMALVWLAPNGAWPETPAPPFRLAVDLADGSHVVGTPSVSHLPFRTPLGQFKLDVQKIRFLSMGTDGETASLTLDNGDVLTATPEWDSLELATAFGKFVFGRRSITRIGPASVPGSMNPAIEGLIRELGDARDEVRQRAISDLCKVGWPAVRALEQAVQSGNSRVAMAARDLLEDGRLGASPQWPAELIEKLRRYRELSDGERDGLVGRILSEMKAESVPFLLVRLYLGNDTEKDNVLARLKKTDSERIAGRLVETLKEPKNQWQIRALAWAHVCRHQPREALRVLTDGHAEDDARREIIEQTIKELVRQLKARDFSKAASAAAEFAEAAPTEARFLYVQAQAWRQLGKRREAEQLEARALRLNSADESSHYTAGDLLTDLGLDGLAIPEWELILKIDPVDDVYDVNAYLRLGQIAARRDRCEDAARNYEKALTIYRDRRAGGQGFGIVGTTEEGLETMIRQLRQKAKVRPVMAVGAGPKQLHVEVTAIVKDGKGKAMRKALAAIKASLTVQIEPLGLRLLDLKECQLKYDPGKEEIAVRLRDSPCGPAHRCRLGKEPSRISVQALDCVYVFEVDPQSGQVTKRERFEMDYRVKVVPDESLRDYQGKPLKVGDHEYSWKDLRNGATMDFLSNAMEIILEGPGRDGRPEMLKFKLPIDERAFKTEEAPE